MSQKSKRAREEALEVDADLPPSKVAKTSESAAPSDVRKSNLDGGDNNLAAFGDVIPAEARTALDVLHAIQVAPELLPRIGKCPLHEKYLRIHYCYEEEEEDDDEDGEEDEEDEEDDEAVEKKKKKDSPPQTSNLESLRRIQDIIGKWQLKYPCSAQSYSKSDQKEDLKRADFTVTIKLPALQLSLGKEESGESTFRLSDFNAPLSQFVSGGAVSSSETKGSPPSLLSHMFGIGTASPFGQVKTLETLVDETVHKARQIDAENFSVSPSLISEVEKIWSERFYPSRVQAVPYKIKLYGTDGMFKPHKDTPETGLVGTFLVGLTDENCDSFHLRVGKQKWDSANGTWCAFYPDVVHQVLAQGDAAKFPHRGTIAFKIFAKSPQPVESFEDALEELDSVSKPFGILLRHNYSTECHRGILKGADAALFECISKLKNCRTKLLPVITSATWSRNVSEYEPASNECSVDVYPFTEAMIQACLATRSRSASSRRSRRRLGDDDDEEGEGDDPAGARLAISQWPKELKGIPFITTEEWDSQVLLHKEDEGAEHTGNESRPAEEHSIYISAAIVVLPASKEN